MKKYRVFFLKKDYKSKEDLEDFSINDLGFVDLFHSPTDSISLLAKAFRRASVLQGSANMVEIEEI